MSVVHWSRSDAFHAVTQHSRSCIGNLSFSLRPLRLGVKSPSCSKQTDRKPAMPRLTWLIICLFVLIIPRLTHGQDSNSQFVPALFQPKKDTLGFTWDITSNGRIQYGTSRVFNGCAYLQVNGSGFSTSSGNERKMRRDGSEFFLARNLSGVNVTRRIKVDVKTGTVRYVEIFENPGTSPIALTVTLGTSLKVAPQAAITDKGKPVQLATPPGTPFLDRGETGIVAFRSQTSTTPYGTQPSALFFLAGRGGKVRPSRNNSGNQQSYVFLYRFVVPPKQKAAVLHGIAQRHFKSQPSPVELARQFRVFQSGSWVRDLPVEIRKSIVNAQVSTLTEQPTVNILQATNELADAWSVERNEKDILVFDEETHVSGLLAGEGISVSTQFGEATVPIAEVAALVGTAGDGRPTRIHLRNGEILVGPLQFESLRFKSEADLQFELKPEHLNVLFTRRLKNGDSPTQPDVKALLETRQGDRLALSSLSGLKLSLVTAFGPHHVSLEDVRSAVAALSPQPIYRFVLKDGSQMSAMIRFDPLSVETRRFGTQEVESPMIASFVQLGKETDKRPSEPAAKFKLNGDNVLVGKPAVGELTVATAAGEVPVNAAQIRSMTRVGQSDDISPAFEFEMADGSKFEGRIVGSLLGIESALKTWQVQVAQINSFVQADSQSAMARRLAAELDSLEPAVAAKRLKDLVNEKEIAVAAMTLLEMSKERSAAILEAAKSLDANFAEAIAERMQKPEPDDDSTSKDSIRIDPPVVEPPALPPSGSSGVPDADPFGRAVPSSGGDPFGGADPFGNSQAP